MNDSISEPIAVAVVGGGLAGLTAAISAAEAHPGARVVLFDPHPLGGRARCDERSGFVFNRGPRALYPNGPLDRFLRAHDVALTGSQAPVVGGTTLDGGRLHAIPASPVGVARTTLFTLREKIAIGRAFTRLPRLDPETYRGRSLEYLAADLGLAGAGRRFLEALVRLATYAHAPDTIDAGAAIAQVKVAAGSGVTYLDGGWQRIVDHLDAVAQALGVERRNGVEVVEVGAPDPTGLRVLATSAGSLTAKAVVLAAGGPDAAARLVGADATMWSGVGPPARAACLELGVRVPPPTRFVLGVDEPIYLSTHCPPAALAPPGMAVVHLMRYLGPDEDLDADQVRAQLRRVAAQAGITDADIVEDRFLARMTVTHGIPTAAGGGARGRPSPAIDGQPGVFVAGDWVGSGGLLADAAVASGIESGRLAGEASATMSVT